MRGLEATNYCIVDDDDEFVQFLVKYLEAKGWRAKGYVSGEALLEAGTLADFDFFIVDLGLPGIDGVDLVTLIRSRSDAGILIVSGRMGPDAFNSALAAGADMFINKPARFDQIYHAIMSVCRRIPIKGGVDASWTMRSDPAALISPDGRQVPLSPLEMSLINRLLEARGTPVSREELAQASGAGGAPEFRNLDAAIFRLRRKIERDAARPSPFRTVHGKGYQLSEPLLLDAVNQR